jgi:hypothetical protein
MEQDFFNGKAWATFVIIMALIGFIILIVWLLQDVLILSKHLGG